MNYSLKNGLVHSQKCCQAYHGFFPVNDRFLFWSNMTKEAYGFL